MVRQQRSVLSAAIIPPNPPRPDCLAVSTSPNSRTIVRCCSRARPRSWWAAYSASGGGRHSEGGTPLRVERGSRFRLAPLIIGAMRLDPRTAAVTLAIVWLAVSALSAAAWWTRRRYDGFGRFAIAGPGTVLALLLLSLRHIAPDWVSILGANGVLGVLDKGSRVV